MSWAPLALSFEVAAVAALLAFVFAIGFGGLTATRRWPGAELLDALCTAPLVMPPTVLGYYVLVTLGHRSPLGHLYETLVGSPLVFTKAGAVVAAAIGAFPIAFKACRAAFESVDARLVSVARTLGASPLGAFWRVQLPLARRGLVAAVTLAFARSIGEFGITLMVAGDFPGRTQTASLAIYDFLAAGRDHEALVLSATLTLFAVAALYAVNRLSLPRR